MNENRPAWLATRIVPGVALLALVGRAFNVAPFKSIAPQQQTMSMVTTICEG